MQIGHNTSYISPQFSRHQATPANQATPNGADNAQHENNQKTSGATAETSKNKVVSQTNKPEVLDDQEKKLVQELKARDREVRAHEQAHKTAAGQHAQGISFQLKRGPDGVSYAASGEVQIDSSPISGDPEATLAKAQTIVAAALAPAQPSAQDFSVAADARQMAAQARAELTSETLQARDTQTAKEDSSSAQEDNGASENAPALDHTDSNIDTILQNSERSTIVDISNQQSVPSGQTPAPGIPEENERIPANESSVSGSHQRRTEQQVVVQQYQNIEDGYTDPNPLGQRVNLIL